MRPNIVDKCIYYISDVFSKRRKTVFISQKMYLWNNKPIREKSVLLWDLENISFNRLGDIKRLAKYTPEDLYVITKQRLSDKQRVKIEKEHFKILDAHNGISDDKIISIMKLYKSKPDMILISSDADFVKEVNRYIKNSKLQWIVADVNKKGIIMKVNIDSNNLSISTLAQRNKSKHYTKSKKYKRSNVQSANIKSEYNLYQYYQYFYGVLARKHRTFIDYLKILFAHTEDETNSIKRASENIQKISIDEVELINMSSISSRFVYRYNFKSKVVVCGKIQIKPDGEKILMLRNHLKFKYDIFKFSKLIRFTDYSEVSNLINYDIQKDEYFLNRFDRL